MSEGSNGQRVSVTSTLVLTFEHDTFKLEVKGEAPNLEVMLAIVDQAKRHLEAQLRVQHAMALQNQITEQQRNQNLSEQIRRRMA